MDWTAKFSPQGLVSDFIGEAQIDNEATKRVLNGLPQLVFISPESIINNPRFHNTLYMQTRFTYMRLAIIMT